MRVAERVVRDRRGREAVRSASSGGPIRAGPPVRVPVWWRAGVQPSRASDAAKYLAACLQLQVQRRPQLYILVSGHFKTSLPLGRLSISHGLYVNDFQHFNT